MEAKFYKHDSYLEMRRKFTGAWENLRLELHRMSPKFFHAGDDEFAINTVFFPLETANEWLFTLTGEMTKAAARKLFSGHYSYRGKPGDWIDASIEGNLAGEFTYPSEADTLNECNNPFYLPLNKYDYAEFKRRFSTRWTNLSIEIYQTNASNRESKELRDDFEMKNFTRVNRLVMKDIYERNGARETMEKLVNDTVLRDKIFLSYLANRLGDSGIHFRIKNNRLGIYWDKNLPLKRLRDFQEAAGV